MRRFLIIHPGTLAEHLAYAQQEGISEIVEGVPPALADELADVELPYIYEEPAPPPAPEPGPDPIEELRAELAETKAALVIAEQDRLDLLEITMSLWEQVNFPDL